MRLNELKEAQVSEILDWADSLDKILTPDSIVPEHIKDFPLAMEVSTRLKIVCKSQVKLIKEKILAIEDAEMNSIEKAEFTFKYNSAGMPVVKKKFPTVEKQKRELRRRLAFNDDWRNLRDEQHQWEMMVSDWVAHHERLRREMHILHSEYDSTGSNLWQRNNDKNFNEDANREPAASNGIGATGKD
jgi:hypothetical protein